METNRKIYNTVMIICNLRIIDEQLYYRNCCYCNITSCN